VRPLVDHAMMVTSPAAIERRVLTFTDPEALGGPGSTCTNLTTALQILLPGEKARPHRHAMNALRFVIEGGGASTVVDGKDCLMEPGAALAKLGRLEEAKAAAAKVLELHPTFRFSRQFAGVNCAPALADPMSEALRMAGLPE
jgi:gentisate 1,2-dioxygenase